MNSQAGRVGGCRVPFPPKPDFSSKDTEVQRTRTCEHPVRFQSYTPFFLPTVPQQNPATNRVGSHDTRTSKGEPRKDPGPGIPFFVSVTLHHALSDTAVCNPVRSAPHGRARPVSYFSASLLYNLWRHLLVMKPPSTSQ